MKRSSNKFVFITGLVACCAALLLSSCTKKTSEAIIGKWQDVKDNSVTEFKSDGTVSMTGPGAPAMTGTYKFTDDTHFSASVSMPMPPEAKGKVPAGTPDTITMTADCTVKITGDEMDIDAKMSIMGQPPQPDHSHFKRVK